MKWSDLLILGRLNRLEKAVSELDDALAAEHAAIAQIATDATDVGTAVTSLIDKINSLGPGATPEEIAQVQADAAALGEAHNAFVAAVAAAATATGSGSTPTP